MNEVKQILINNMSFLQTCIDTIKEFINDWIKNYDIQPLTDSNEDEILNAFVAWTNY